MVENKEEVRERKEGMIESKKDMVGGRMDMISPASPGVLGSPMRRLRGPLKTINPTSYGISDFVAAMGGGLKDPPYTSWKESFWTLYCYREFS